MRVSFPNKLRFLFTNLRYKVTVQTIADHSVMRDLLHYSERIALRVGKAESWTVFAIYLALLDSAQEHPGWESV